MAEEAAGVEELKEQLLRLRADFENAKKRLERDKTEAVRFANEKFLGEILHAVDNFDRAVASLNEGHDLAGVKKGLALAQEELHRVLERNGVEPVKSVGGAFDPQLHEAVSTVESDDADEGTILREVQKGYTLNGRLLRPSRVQVSKKKDSQ